MPLPILGPHKKKYIPCLHFPGNHNPEEKCYVFLIYNCAAAESKHKERVNEAGQEGKHRWVTYCHCLISNSPDCLILTDCLLRGQLPLRIVCLEKEEKGNSCVLSSCVCRKVLLCLKASVTELGSKGA